MKTTLTAFVPAHKQTNPEHKPGQVVNPLGFTDTTLGDYIRRKDAIHKAFDQVKKGCCGNPLRTGPNGRGCENCPPQEKLTFEAYWAQVMPENDYDMSRWKEEFKCCWEAAQENK